MKLLTILILTTIHIQARIIHSVDIFLMPSVFAAHCVQLKEILGPLPSWAQFSREPDTKHMTNEINKIQPWLVQWGKGSGCLICMFHSCITHASSRFWSFIYDNPHWTVSTSESPKSRRLNLGSLPSLNTKKLDPFWLSKWMTCYGQGFPCNVLDMSGSSDHLRKTSTGKSHKWPYQKKDVGRIILPLCLNGHVFWSFPSF